ncbi:hypothetical protein D3C78_980190 [compost metagenome]
MNALSAYLVVQASDRHKQLREQQLGSNTSALAPAVQLQHQALQHLIQLARIPEQQIRGRLCDQLSHIIVLYRKLPYGGKRRLALPEIKFNVKHPAGSSFIYDEPMRYIRIQNHEFSLPERHLAHAPIFPGCCNFDSAFAGNDIHNFNGVMGMEGHRIVGPLPEIISKYVGIQIVLQPFRLKK